MDKASAYGAGDCRFESYQDHGHDFLRVGFAAEHIEDSVLSWSHSSACRSVQVIILRAAALTRVEPHTLVNLQLMRERLNILSFFLQPSSSIASC